MPSSKTYSWATHVSGNYARPDQSGIEGSPIKGSIDCSGPAEDMADEQGTDAKLQDLQLDEAEDKEEAAGAEEEENAEPAAKDGWNEDETQKDAIPQAGPQGLASQSAAAQVGPNSLAVRWPFGGGEERCWKVLCLVRAVTTY